MIPVSIFPVALKRVQEIGENEILLQRLLKEAWNKTLSNKGLLGVIGAPKMPTALSDHGVQMANLLAFN